MMYNIFTLLNNLFDLYQVSLSKMAKHWDSFLSNCKSIFSYWVLQSCTSTQDKTWAGGGNCLRWNEQGLKSKHSGMWCRISWLTVGWGWAREKWAHAGPVGMLPLQRATGRMCMQSWDSWQLHLPQHQVVLQLLGPCWIGPHLLRKVHAGHEDHNMLLVLDQFWALIYGHLHTKSIWNLKQVPKMQISQNQCYFPTFLPRFWWFSQALKTLTSTKGLAMSTLHCSPWQSNQLTLLTAQLEKNENFRQVGRMHPPP